VKHARSIRILYIEDDPGLARLLQKRLAREGYRVDIASDGEEGIAAYHAGSYDILFVDQSLPGYDGLQVIRTLAADGPLPPIVMITGTGDERVAVEAMKLGTSDYIVKDVEGGYLHLLPSVIEKVLQQRRAVAEKEHAEQALKKEQEKFQTVVEQSPLGISITGQDGRLLYINPMFTTLFGYTPADIPTKHAWFATAYPDEKYREEVVAAWVKDQKKLNRRQLLARMFTVTCKDGSQKMILFRPSIMENGDQFITYEDITDRVQAEKTLRESGDKLEKLHDVARRLALCTSDEEAYRVAIEAAKKMVTFSFCSLEITAGKEMVTKFVYPPSTAHESAGPTIHRQAMPNASGAPGCGEIEKEAHARSFQTSHLSLINVPIGDLGIFQAASVEPNAFSQDDRRLLELLFGHTAAAIKRVRLQEELKEQAVHDPLTGLYNRYYLSKILEHEVKRSKRYHHGMTLMMIDVNRFKEINDQYGHQTGDEVLRGVAELLHEAVRESDIVVRYGGDEFLIVFPETVGDINSIRERIIGKVNSITERNRKVTFPVTLSIGSACWNPKGKQPVDEILNEADKKMYEDKKRHTPAKRAIHA
jgi:diguanylate cyclase (GGDEF)-like protein/PAS domain S-box-containing protein